MKAKSRYPLLFAKNPIPTEFQYIFMNDSCARVVILLENYVEILWGVCYTHTHILVFDITCIGVLFNLGTVR